MSECRCAVDEIIPGHAEYCPVWKDERIAELERRLSDTTGEIERLKSQDMGPLIRGIGSLIEIHWGFGTQNRLIPLIAERLKSFGVPND